jgi:hypothetical protein
MFWISAVCAQPGRPGLPSLNSSPRLFANCVSAYSDGSSASLSRESFVGQDGGSVHSAGRGTSLLPEKVRITNYKLWMRSALILWWVVLLLGFATFTRWYVPHFFRK